MTVHLKKLQHNATFKKSSQQSMSNISIQASHQHLDFLIHVSSIVGFKHYEHK